MRKRLTPKEAKRQDLLAQRDALSNGYQSIQEERSKSLVDLKRLEWQFSKGEINGETFEFRWAILKDNINYYSERLRSIEEGGRRINRKIDDIDKGIDTGLTQDRSEIDKILQEHEVEGPARPPKSLQDAINGTEEQMRTANLSNDVKNMAKQRRSEIERGDSSVANFPSEQQSEDEAQRIETLRKKAGDIN